MAKRNKIKDMPIRKAFVCYVLVTFLIVLLLSAVTIGACVAVQNILLPEKEQAVLSIKAKSEDGSEEQEMSMILTPGKDMPFLMKADPDSGEDGMTTYAFERVENSYKSLTPKRQFVYAAASVAMVLLPLLYCIFAILLCAYRFYRQKLKEPLLVLEKATEQIRQQNLDFRIYYEGNDELGKLCSSFEAMRKALLSANREMWNMLEERKKLQASIAHDLRNPIAIIKGYAEYLQIHIPQGCVSREEEIRIAEHLGASANRLESYTESIRSINHLEALEICRKICNLPEFLERAAADMEILARENKKSLRIMQKVNRETAFLDCENCSRVLENLMQNAFRFAKQGVELSFMEKEGCLEILIRDDGPGFPEKILERKEHRPVLSEDEHIGMGLAVSQILCRKHDGFLKLENDVAGGAAVKAVFGIEENN